MGGGSGGRLGVLSKRIRIPALSNPDCMMNEAGQILHVDRQ